MTDDEEKYCLEALSKGDRLAFERLFLEWHPRVVDFFTRLLGDECEETAYDYAQDVFYDVWMSRKKFSEVKNFSGYLFQMARFKVYNHFDKSSVIRRFQHDSMITGSDSTRSGEDYLYASETNSVIRKALDAMPQKRRKVFIMSRVLGISNDRIAQELGINKRTVENHITNVLAVLRKVIKAVAVLCVLWR